MRSIMSRVLWKRLNIGWMVLFCVGCFGLDPVQSQDPSDPIGSAKLIPPHLLDKSANEFHLVSIDWELKQQVALMTIYEQSKNRLSVRFDETNQQLRQLNKQLPPEVRFVNTEVRSRLIGKAMEEMLHAKLDLATREKSLILLEQRLEEEKENNHSRLLREQEILKVESAKMKVDITTSQFERIKQLATTGTATTSEARMAEYELSIARQELAAAELQAQVAAEKNNSEIAAQLVDARVSIEPVKARIKAIDSFLMQFSETADTVSKIEHVQRQLDLWRSDYDLVVKELIRINRDVEELRVLKDQIEDALKEMGKKKAAESKD